jgi:hypothetical protein
MKIKELLSRWTETANGALTQEIYEVRLPVEDAAKLQALAEMFPRRNVTDIITELLSASLNEMESSLPYVSGDKVVALDEEGDPIYEDIGPTPRFLALSQKKLQEYRRQLADPH